MTRRLERSVVLPASSEAVWKRAVTPEGFNHEMRPWLTMTMPKSARHLTVDTVPLGQPIGRAKLRLLGVLPIDYDRLVIVEREPGLRFLERSTMGTMRLWQHERTLTPTDSGTAVHDSIVFEPRVLLRPLASILAWGIDHFFRHRHRRLESFWALTGKPSGRR